MSCENRINKNITSNCETSTTAGIEQDKIYLFNRKDITATFDTTQKNKVTALSVATGAKGYYAKGTKKLNTAGFELVTGDYGDSWKNTLSLVGFEFDSESALNFDTMGDIVAVVERNDGTSGDGAFLILGLVNGLHQATNTWNANDNNGTRQMTLESLDGAGEKFSYYVFDAGTYATSKAALEALLTTQQ